jgi:hypothetical protein
MVAMNKIISYAISMILLIIILMVFFAQSGMWEDLKDIISDAEEVIPDDIKAGIGLEGISAEIALPEDKRSEILVLVDTIESMIGKEECFLDGVDFSDLGDVSLELEKVGDNMTIMIMGGAGGKQIITDFKFEIEGVQPCVIAGIRDTSENFKNYYLFDEEKTEPLFQPVNKIMIKYSTDGFNGNRMFVPELGEDVVNDQTNNMLNGGWLFTPDGKNICFFPTRGVTSPLSPEDGLYDNFFTESITRKNSIPKMIVQPENRVKHCLVK